MMTGWPDHHHGPHESLVHRLPASPKLLVALVMIVGTVCMPPRFPGWFIGVAVVLGVVIVIGGISPWFLLKRLLLLSPFILGVALVNAWEPTSRVAWFEVAIKSALCLVTVIVVSNTTPFSRILRTLKTVRVPLLLVTTIALMHRYIFVLADEAGRMNRARSSRTFTAGRRFQWKSLATVAGQLFIRASARAERIYSAMCARGWK
jgi:cobalt/nickel transport system permease protein